MPTGAQRVAIVWRICSRQYIGRNRCMINRDSLCWICASLRKHLVRSSGRAFVFQRPLLPSASIWFCIQLFFDESLLHVMDLKSNAMRHIVSTPSSGAWTEKTGAVSHRVENRFFIVKNERASRPRDLSCRCRSWKRIFSYFAAVSRKHAPWRSQIIEKPTGGCCCANNFMFTTFPSFFSSETESKSNEILETKKILCRKGESYKNEVAKRPLSELIKQIITSKIYGGLYKCWI